MQCPIDGTQLVMSDRAGVEIDYCPKCRGVWLDRGELDKIIDRSAPQSAPEPRRDPHPEPRRDYGGEGKYRKPYKKKSKSFLSEIFDFD